MTIASEISRLSAAKAELKTALEGKGVAVPAAAKLDVYPELVNSIAASSLPACYVSYELSTAHRVVGAEVVGFQRLMERMFYGCIYLEQITLPAGLTHIGNYCFYSCSSLNGVSFPDSLTHIYSAAFQDCSSIRQLEIPAGITSIAGAAFRGCTSMESLWVKGNPTISGALHTDAVFASCTGLHTVTLGSPGRPVTFPKIGFLAFYDCNITDMTIYTAGGSAINGAPFGATVTNLTYLPA